MGSHSKNHNPSCLLISNSTYVLFLGAIPSSPATTFKPFFGEETAAHKLPAILRECAIVVFSILLRVACTSESALHQVCGSFSLTLMFAGFSSCRANGSWRILAGCMFASLLLCSQAQAAQVPSNAAEPYYEQGLQSLRQQQWQSASSSFEEALKLDPRRADAENGLGVALGKLGDQRNSLAAFRRAIEIDPGYAEAHYNLALWLQVSGDADQAISELTNAVKLKPDYGLELLTHGRMISWTLSPSFNKPSISTRNISTRMAIWLLLSPGLRDLTKLYAYFAPRLFWHRRTWNCA